LASPSPTADSHAVDVDNPRLRIRDIVAGYGSKQVLHGVDVSVPPGSIVALFGHNGAGKSTTLAAAFGMLTPSSGSIELDGLDATRMTPHARVKAGMAYVPSDNFVFPRLSVRENLVLGAHTVGNASLTGQRLDQVFEVWPILKDRVSQMAGTMSGGQRRILSLGIALMSGPSLLLLDEPSLGLAPVVVDELFEQLRTLAHETHLSVLLVEQSVGKTLRIADDAYVMQAGRVVAHEAPHLLAQRENLWGLF